MKQRSYLLMLVFFLLSQSAAAQFREVDFIIRPALTGMHGVNNSLYPTIRLSGGIGVSYQIKENTFIHAGLLYDQKGASSEDTGYFNSSPDPGAPIIQSRVIVKEYFDYITMPVQWVWQFGNKVKFQAGAGIYGSVLLKESSIVESSILNANTDYTKNFKRADLGLSFSISALVPIGEKVSIKAGLDDNLGLLNTSSLPVKDDGAIRHNSLGVVAGVVVRIRD